jgi:acyl-coenzyme A thioesterase 13
VTQIITWSGSLILAPRKGPEGTGSGAQNLIGYDIDFDTGQPRIILELGPQHMNRNGSLHGGIFAMMLDAAAGYAASLSLSDAGNAPLVTLSLTTQFLAAGVGGKVIATGTHKGGGRSIIYADSEMRDEAGTLLATGVGVFKAVRKRTET